MHLWEEVLERSHGSLREETLLTWPAGSVQSWLVKNCLFLLRPPSLTFCFYDHYRPLPSGGFLFPNKTTLFLFCYPLCLKLPSLTGTQRHLPLPFISISRCNFWHDVFGTVELISTCSSPDLSRMHFFPFSPWFHSVPLLVPFVKSETASSSDQGRLI